MQHTHGLQHACPRTRSVSHPHTTKSMPCTVGVMLLAFLVFTTSVVAEGNTGIAARVARIDRMLQAELGKNGIPGAAVGIAHKGATVYAKGFGFGDVENRVPFTAQTVSRIGSISKTFTALAVMQLVEQEKIKLDDEVQVYVPGFPRKTGPITVRDLLCHQGGVRHYRPGEMLSAKRYASVEEALGVFKDDDLVAPPGTKYSYTTYGYTLLTRVVEAASGLSFIDYLQQHIIDPLELNSTFPDDPPRLIPNRARNYTRNGNGELENAPAVDQSNKWGGGGLLSTIEDLLRYAASYDDCRLLKAETMAAMFTPQSTSNGDSTEYGFGWRIGRDGARRRIEHTGGSVGATSVLSTYPDDATAIVVLVNNDFFKAADLRAKVAALWFAE